MFKLIWINCLSFNQVYNRNFMWPPFFIFISFGLEPWSHSLSDFTWYGRHTSCLILVWWISERFAFQVSRLGCVILPWIGWSWVPFFEMCNIKILENLRGIGGDKPIFVSWCNVIASKATGTCICSVILPF